MQNIVQLLDSIYKLTSLLQKIYQIRILFIFLFLYSPIIFAETSIPNLQGRVNDLEGILDTTQIEALENRLKNLEAQKGSQMAILIISTTDGESIEQFSLRVVEKWKLGRKGIDDGILLLIAIKDRKMRIEVGYGLEDVLPDAICKRIISEQMRPHFKERNYYEGINNAVESITKSINGENLPPPIQTSIGSNTSNDNFILIFIFSIFLIFLGSAITNGFADTSFGQWLGSAIFSLAGSYVNARLFSETNGVSFLIIIFAWFISFIILTLLIFFAIRVMGSGGGNGTWSSGSSSSWSDSSSSSWSSSSSSDSFSGGGGSFGGGGASGDW